jgi:hypothetical protein
LASSDSAFSHNDPHAPFNGRPISAVTLLITRRLRWCIVAIGRTRRQLSRQQPNKSDLLLHAAETF